MNTDLRFDGIELWQLAGWTMLHFLWLGTLVGLVAGACRLLLRQASPNVRYATAVTTLVVLASLQLSIAAWLVITYPTDFLTEDAPAALGFAAGPTATPTQISPPIDQTIGEIIELSGRNDPPPSERVPTAPGSPGLSLPKSAGGLSTDGGLTSDQAAVPTAASTAPLTDGTRAVTLSPDVIFESLQSFALYLPWIWLVGTPITFALLATGLVGTRRLRLASRPIHDGPIAEVLAQLTTSLRIGKRVGLAVCDRIATPVLVGILRPIILLPPAALTGWSPDEIEMVLLHELAHVRRWDNLVNLAQRIVESLLFFHPVVWLVSNWIRREREACCDALVVDRTKRPHAYAELLVALAAELPRSVLFKPAASSAMAAGPLRNRIRRILQLEDDPMLVSGKSFALVLGSLLVAATFAVLYLPAIGQAEDSTTEDTESTETMPATPVDSAGSEELGTERLPINTPSGNVVIEAHNEPEQRRLTSNGTPEFDRPTGDGETTTEFQAYNVPDELIQYVETWAQLMKVRGYSDRPGRFIMQASVDVHAQLDELLKATPEWLKTAAVAQREDDPIRNYESNGQTRVEWRRMGMTVGPAREFERAATLPRQVVGLEIVAVEPGSPAAWLTIRPNDTLISISSFETTSVPQFKSMIRTMLDGSTKTRHTITIVKSNGEQLRTYLPQSKKIGVADESEQAQSSRNAGADSSNRAPFPSLEEQKLADLAFKRLGLELETLDDEDLRRVKALGYDGGVKVTSGAAGTQHPFIQTTDIVVGLHVWPTMNLQDVAAVLNRDDLAELNPLKFYVVRKREDNSNTDEVISGRVSVNLSARGRGTIRSTTPAAPQSAAPAGDLSKYVAESMTDAGIDPQAGPVQVEMVPHESGSALVVRGAAKTDPDIPRYVLPSAAEEDSHPKSPKTDIPGMTPRPPRSPQPQAAAAPPSPAASAELPSRPAASPTNLLYEGKTFEEWRDASRIELSTERHLTAVQALAAFGANGYASEATEAILDVAGKYDFRVDVQRQSAESNLRSAIRRSFTSPRGIDPKIAFPMIMKRYTAAPEVWHGFVVYLLSWRVPLESKEMVELARPLLEHQDPEMRAAALEAIYRTNPDDSDEILAAALRDESPKVVAKALEIVASNEDRNTDRQSEPTGLNLRRVDFPVEEFVAILVSFRPDGFNPNEGAVRQILTDLSLESADRVRNQLLEIVNDPSRKDQHLYAIRAIGAIRRGRSSGADNPSTAILETIVRESDDLTLRVAAAGAISRNGGRSRHSLDHLNDEVDNLPADAPQRDQMRELIDAERRGNW